MFYSMKTETCSRRRVATRPIRSSNTKFFGWGLESFQKRTGGDEVERRDWDALISFHPIPKLHKGDSATD